MKRPLLLCALAACTLLAVIAASASANRLSLSEKNYELIWNAGLGAPKTPFIWSDEGGHRISCNLTLLGRFTGSTLAKNTTANQSTINHAELEGCRGGTMTIKTETLPWTLRYRSFTGALPSSITAISYGLIGMAVRIESGGLSCEPRTEEEHPLVTILESFTGGAPENARLDETRTIPLSGFICSFVGSLRVSGIGLVRNLPRTARITVTLI